MHALADMRGALRDWTEVGPEKSTSWGCKHPPRIVQYNRDKYTKGERKIQSRIKARNKTNWGVDLSGVLIFFLFPFCLLVAWAHYVRSATPPPPLPDTHFVEARGAAGAEPPSIARLKDAK